MAVHLNASTYLSLASGYYAAYPLTISWRMNVQAFDGSQDFGWGYSNNAGSDWFGSSVADSAGTDYDIIDRDGANNHGLLTNQPYATGVWAHHLQGGDASGICIFRNGSGGTAGGDSETFPTTDAFTIGDIVGLAAINAYFAELVVWSEPLASFTAAVAQYLSNGGNPLALFPDNIEHYWPLRVAGDYTCLITGQTLSVAAGTPATVEHPYIAYGRPRSNPWAPPQTLAAGQAIETDSALAATASKILVPGFATETDSALAVGTPQKVKAVGIATEIDSGLAATVVGGAGAVLSKARGFILNIGRLMR